MSDYEDELAEWFEGTYHIPRTNENDIATGGRKSDEHIAGQFRLQKVYQFYGAVAFVEEPVYLMDDWGEFKQYQVDLMVCNAGTLKNIMACEVDTYTYGTGKKKSPAHMNNRDKLITSRYKIPIIRYDIDALKEGRKKTEFYMSDEEIFKYGYKCLVAYFRKLSIQIPYKFVT